MFDRIPDARYRELIGAALDRLPPGIRHRIGRVPFLCGVDPVFAGLHAFATTDDGRRYADTAHTVWPIMLAHRPAADRHTTVVLPCIVRLADVVHELGHVLDERIGWERHRPAPVSPYAATNTHEAWAEAVTASLIPGYARRPDDRTIALLEELARPPL